MSKKNTNRRPANRNSRRKEMRGDLAPKRAPLKGDLGEREEAAREARREARHRRAMEAFAVVAPVVERLASSATAFAMTEAGIGAAERADRLIRDGASSALGQRLLGAIIGGIERHIDLDLEDAAARQEIDLDRLKREHERAWGISEPKPEPEPEPKPEPKHKERPDWVDADFAAEFAAKLEATRSAQAQAREELIEEMRKHEKEAQRLRQALHAHDNRR